MTRALTPIQELLAAIAPLRRADLEMWISASLVVAHHGEGGVLFTASACARVRLLCTLRYELELEDDAMELALSLMDQLYATRGRLQALGAAVAAQPPEVQAAIMAALKAGKGGAQD